MNHLILGKISSNFPANTKNNSVRFFQKAHSFSCSVSKADEQKFDDENNGKKRRKLLTMSNKCGIFSIDGDNLIASLQLSGQSGRKVWAHALDYDGGWSRRSENVQAKGTIEPLKVNINFDDFDSTWNILCVNIERVDKPFQIESQ
jgi:hypothetical protein